MIKYSVLFYLIVVIPIGYGQNGHNSSSVPLSEQTQECIECHEGVTPGIVADWHKSRHARTTPETALTQPALGKRISAPTIPESLATVAVGCYECHSLNSTQHKDNFEHFDRAVNVIVTPNDCNTCHPTEVEQYTSSKKGHALDNLRKNPVYHALVETITGVKSVQDSTITRTSASEQTKSETCYACHGAEIIVSDMHTVSTDMGDVDFPNLVNWPNHGVGRINPDGSHGACTPCHPRHSFSIEIARKPYTCSQCHLDPDVPAWNVYRESKHGNIFMSIGHQWNWDNVPWVVGADFSAPACATCHNSLLTSPDGDVIAQRTHDFGERLWVRLFGLIYAHPQPKRGETYLIKNEDGLPLPSTFSGKFASQYLLDENTQKARRHTMLNICQTCHSTDFAEGHFNKLANTVVETNQMTLAATQLVLEAWKNKFADPQNPFDEGIEHKWVKQWLFYGNTVRYASAMGGPDYGAFKNGWWELSENLQRMHDALKVMHNKKK